MQGKQAAGLGLGISRNVATTAVKAAGAGASEISSILEQRILGHTRYGRGVVINQLPLIKLWAGSDDKSVTFNQTMLAIL